MLADRARPARVIQYHAIKNGEVFLKNQIAIFVRGIKGPRRNPVSKKSIFKWFAATDRNFLEQQLLELCANGRIRVTQKNLSSGRRANGSYIYEVAE